MEGHLLHVKLPPVMKVTSPHKLCRTVDNEFGVPNVVLSLWVHANANASAGWFAPIKTARTLKEGDALVLTTQPARRWTLECVTKVLYEKRRKEQQCANRACMEEGQEGRRELDQLGETERREKARRLLEVIHGGGHESGWQIWFDFLANQTDVVERI